MRRALLVVLVLCVVAARRAETVRHAQGDGSRWWSDVKALSHDSMAGRQTGSATHRQAALYIAGAFKAAGLQPMGTKGFLQPVAFVERRLDEAQSSLTLVHAGGKEEPLVLGQDASFVLRAPLAPRVEAPVVFAGYGLGLPEYGHDDLKGLDLKGKVVAYLTGAPKGVPGPVLSHARNQAWQTFKAAGAVGMITFSGNRRADSVFTRTARNRLAPQMALAEAALDLQGGNTLSVQMNAARGEKLFAGSKVAFPILASEADSGLALQPMALAVRIRSATHLTESPLVSDNVVGLLPGNDPTLKNEYVVLTAHLDHVGIGRPVNGDSIYNGAMDNASGAALLMDVARVLGAERKALKRSVLFVAVTGEEHGLLGSRWYANHPTVPAASIIADLNTDMFLPIIPFKMLMVNGLEESDLSANALAAGAATGVQVITDPEPEENRFVRSDQYSFILRGVPALSLKVGFMRDSPEHKQVLEFRTKRYHQPSDDVMQPVDQKAAAEFEKTYIALVKEVANRPTRPRWLGDSYFRKFARPRS